MFTLGYIENSVPEPSQPPLQHVGIYDRSLNLVSIRVLGDLLVGGERTFQQVQAFRLGNEEGEPYALAVAKTESTIVVVFLQVELWRAVEGEGGGLRRAYAVQCQAAFVVEILVAAHQIKARPLLGESQRHDVRRRALAAGVAVVHMQPAVAI